LPGDFLRELQQDKHCKMAVFEELARLLEPARTKMFCFLNLLDNISNCIFYTIIYIYCGLLFAA